MKRYQQMEKTTAIVVTKTTIHAETPEDAQASFDDGAWETRVEEVGDVLHLHETDLTEVPEDWPPVVQSIAPATTVDELAERYCEGWCRENGGRGKFLDCTGCEIAALKLTAGRSDAG